jgi:hypothetical protein
MESRRASDQDLRITAWRSVLAEERTSNLSSRRLRIPQQPAPLVPEVIPVVSASDCYGCVDWYAYSSARTPPGADSNTKDRHA